MKAKYNGDQHLSVFCLTHTHANHFLVFHPCWRCSPAFQPHSVRYATYAARTQLDDFAGRLYHSQKTEHYIVQFIIPLGVWYLFTDGKIIPLPGASLGLSSAANRHLKALGGVYPHKHAYQEAFSVLAMACVVPFPHLSSHLTLSASSSTCMQCGCALLYMN